MIIECSLAIVSNIDDPAKGGAIKVALPDIGGDEYPEWIEPIFPAGCWFAMPEVGDTVLVMMPGGDDITEFADEVRYLGRLITEGEGLPNDFKKNYPNRRGIETAGGNQIILDDKTGEVIVKSGVTGSTITMEPSGNIVIKSSTKVHISAPLTDLNVTPTDFVLKGTKFFADFVTTFLDAWKTCLTAASPPLTDPNWGAYKTAMITKITALIGSTSTWLSTTTRTS